MPMRPPPDLDDKAAWSRYELLRDDRVEFGLWVQGLIDEGQSLKGLETRTGKPRSFFQWHRDIAIAVPALQDALTSGRLEWTQARRIANALKDDPDAQLAAVAWALQHYQTTGHSVSDTEVKAYLEHTTVYRPSMAVEAVG